MADNSNKKIAIFPAVGGLGNSITNHLLAQTSPSQLILIARYPEKIPASASALEAGATIRKADYDDAATLEHAFDGVKSLFLISYPSFRHEARVKAHKLAIDTARRSGVKHIFYSSLAFGGDCEPNSVAHVFQAHKDTENYLSTLAASDPTFTYTAIRVGLYSESFPIYTAFFNPNSTTTTTTTTTSTSTIQIPHDGSGPGIAWAKRDELGEACARLILQQSPQHSNKTILLSGPRVWSLAETVDALAKACGRPISIKQVSVDEYAELPDVKRILTYDSGETPRDWATSWEAIRRGETAVVSGLLEEVLGREPEPFDVTLKSLIY